MTEIRNEAFVNATAATLAGALTYPAVGRLAGYTLTPLAVTVTSAFAGIANLVCQRTVKSSLISEDSSKMTILAYKVVAFIIAGAITAFAIPTLGSFVGGKITLNAVLPTLVAQTCTYPLASYLSSSFGTKATLEAETEVEAAKKA